MNPDIKLIFIALLCGGAFMFVMRWLTGWNAFERSYRSGKNLPSGWVSSGSYTRVPASMQGTRIRLAIEVYPEALWLRASFPLSVWCRPLCIPWDAIESVELQVDALGKKTCVKIFDINFPICISGAAGSHIGEVFRLTKAQA